MEVVRFILKEVQVLNTGLKEFTFLKEENLKYIENFEVNHNEAVNNRNLKTQKERANRETDITTDNIEKFIVPQIDTNVQMQQIYSDLNAFLAIFQIETSNINSKLLVFKETINNNVKKIRALFLTDQTHLYQTMDKMY